VIQKRQWLLSGECVEFPTDYSISNLLEWFLVEVAVMPTALTECNENTTCYTLIGIFKILVGRDVNIFRSSGNWLYPVMLHSLKIFLKTSVG
jgi:hypothetical protein